MMFVKLMDKIKLRPNFSTQKYWELRYAIGGNSGEGLYGEICEAKAKAKIINELLEKYSIEDVLEFGCGDGNQLRYYKIKNYLGLDLSPITIDRCAELFKGDNSKSFLAFAPGSLHNGGGVLNKEATMSVEVIFHLVEDTIFQDYLNNLFKASSKYVITLSSDKDEEFTNVVHVKHRKFTDYIEKNFSNFKLIERIPVNSPNGKYFNDVFIYQKD
jgi:SAM-dependent methyltransferase